MNKIELLPDEGLKVFEIGTPQGAAKVPYRDMQHADGLVRIEYYHNDSIEKPDVFTPYRYRMGMLSNEYEWWKTLVTDSVTFMELSARKMEEKILNPMTKFARGTDTRQWFAGGTDSLEEMLVMRMASIPFNVVVICHINERKNEVSGEILRGPFAPGRLATRGLLNAAYQEQYHLETMRNSETGELVRLCQTGNRDGWVACSQIGAPDPCYPHYESLWEGREGGERPPIHALLYGDSGVGKSTMAATFPKPMLVHCFDPFGKDLPYRKKIG